MGVKQLTSKEILEKTGISRATLNNYINQGLIPKPHVAPDDSEGRGAPRIGYFPATVLDIISQIDRLKSHGLRMNQISELLAPQGKSVLVDTPDGAPVDIAEILSEGTKDSEPQSVFEPNAPDLPDQLITQAVQDMARATQRSVPAAGAFTSINLGGPLRLTIESLDSPAYLINRRFEVEWCNEAAMAENLLDQDTMEREMDNRNLFRIFLSNGQFRQMDSREELLRFHLAIARNFLSYEKLMMAASGGERVIVNWLLQTFEDVEPSDPKAGVVTAVVNLAPEQSAPRWYRIYASFFREGVFFTYAPLNEDQESILTLLARRDLVIRDILRRRQPYMTHLAVLVADLQSSCKICAELPPEEYFHLINEIWSAMEPVLRRYYSTHGKHVGDGMLYYFLPQPDSNYVFNAVRCAAEMREKMREISASWNSRKNWINDLKLNFGIDEGKEWFGTYQTPTHIEFTALGDTINRAARLSDFARDGSIWVTKNVLGNLNSDEQDRLTYGVRRRSENGDQVLVRSTFARIGSLIENDALAATKLSDISTLPVTEVLDLIDFQ